MSGYDRRHFLFVASGAVAAYSSAAPKQTFPAGLVPGGLPGGRGARPQGGFSTTPAEAFWQTCDEVQKLGVHHIEINNTHRKVVEAYESRISEFKDEMAKRGVTLLGSAMYSHMQRTELREQLVADHLRVARFLKDVGGRYMDPLIAPGENLGNGTDEEYRSVDVRAWAANANAIGKRVKEETGIQIGLHPEQGDIRANLIDKFMDATDPRFFNIWVDVGHFSACGVDPMSVYKKYRSRMVGSHLRDFQPPPADAPAQNGQPARGRMTPFGQGVIKLPELVGFLRETAFTGPVMGEGGGNQAMRDYMVQKLELTL